MSAASRRIRVLALLVALGSLLGTVATSDHDHSSCINGSGTDRADTNAKQYGPLQAEV